MTKQLQEEKYPSHPCNNCSNPDNMSDKRCINCERNRAITQTVEVARKAGYEEGRRFDFFPEIADIKAMEIGDTIGFNDGKKHWIIECDE